ncbi:MAG TPA: CrcB family protein [Cellulomonas sp.]
MPRPPLVPLPALALVLVGGALGTTARALLESAYGADPGRWPWTTWAINITGSFALGLLTATLSHLPGSRQAGRLRWSLGTGLIGGFTTYSTFVLEVHQLAIGGHLALATGYLLASLVLGVAAAAAGAALGHRWVGRWAQLRAASAGHRGGR